MLLPFDFSATAQQPAPAATIAQCPQPVPQRPDYAEPDGWLLLSAIVVCAAGRLAMGRRH
ncbi:MAG: hypothetical protein ACRYGO_17575 [Janthinobacterium lividum]